MHTRRLLLGGAMALGTSLLLTAQAQQPAPAAGAPATPPVPPMVKGELIAKISPHVWVIPDQNVPLVPNVGIVVGDMATLVVDTGLGAKNAEIVLREVAKVRHTTDLYLVTTHVHPEHDLGAAAFPLTTRMIRSQDQVAEIAASGLEMAKRFATFSPLHAELLKDAKFRKADIVFDVEQRIDLGGVRVRMIAMGFNHTKGDTAIWVETDRVLFTGDVSMKALPNVGNGSTIAQWIASQEIFETLRPTTVVPSHGPTGDATMITTNAKFLGTVQQRVAELKKAGKTAEETVAALQADLTPTYGTSPRMATTIRSAYAQAP
jgi:glyoxylase-like metal-dependent hydrolase (beta-lactamase superfamily II)